MLRRELEVESDLVHGPYGQFKILVDGREVVDAGLMAALGVVPSNEHIVDAVREALHKNPA